MALNKLIGPSNPVHQSKMISNLNKPPIPTGGVVSSPQNVRKSGSKTLDYLRSLNSSNKQVKIAGLVSKVVGKGIKFNLKKNKIGIGLGFAGGFMKNKKIGEGVTGALENGVHVVPGLTGTHISGELKKKPISSRIGERGMISENLRNIQK
jgi:hypothetical protein